MSAHVKMFQPRFAPMVKAGTKLTTIRPTPKRAVKPCDTLGLREWTAGARRKGSTHRILGAGIVESVKTVVLDRDTFDSMELDGEFQAKTESHRAAVADGFSDFLTMME